MLNQLRTLSARLITRHRLGPRTRPGVQVRAWAWLAGETDSLAEKERCLEAILVLDPKLEWAQMALRGAWYQQAQMNWDSPRGDEWLPKRKRSSGAASVGLPCPAGVGRERRGDPGE